MAIVELMEKNRAQAKEIRSLKMKQDPQAMMLCEVTKQKKREVEDRAMLEDEREILQTNLRRSLLNSLRSQTCIWIHLAK